MEYPLTFSVSILIVCGLIFYLDNILLHSYGCIAQTPPSEEKQCYDDYKMQPGLNTAFCRYGCVQHAWGESKVMIINWGSKNS